MSKHYEERYYVRDEIQGDYEEHRRSSSRRRSGSRHRAPPQPPCPEEQYYRQRLARSGSGSSISSISDYDYRANCERPLVRVPRDVIRAPTPPPVIQRVVERAPTPEPDVVERVIVRPQPQQLIERIIERPRTPPPKIIDKEICEPAPPPIVRTRIVKVDHSPRHYANTTPMRYNMRSAAPPCNYAPCTEYTDYMGLGAGGGYDQSYSQSYSTTELFPPSTTPYMNSGYPGPAYQASQPPPPPPPPMYGGTSYMTLPPQMQQMQPHQLMQQQTYAQAVPTGPPVLQYGYSFNNNRPGMASFTINSPMQQQQQQQQMQPQGMMPQQYQRQY